MEQDILELASWDQAVSGGHPLADEEPRGIPRRVDDGRSGPSHARVRERRVVDRPGTTRTFGVHCVLLPYEASPAFFLSFQLCFLVVVIGVSGVVVTCYSYVIPALSESHPIVAVFWVLYGHYLLINIVFHYYKGFRVGPGQPTVVSDRGK